MSLTSRRTAMARKRYKPEEIVAKLRQVDVLVSQGQNMVDAIRQIGVSEVTYYRWRQEFGGLKTEQVKRLKDLELENSRLRKAVSDLTLDKLILQEGRPGKRTNKKPTANIRRSCSDSSVTASQMDGVFGRQGLLTAAEPLRRLGNAVEHGLHVRGRAGDDAEHLADRGLIVERLLNLARTRPRAAAMRARGQ